ncbi:hypothetical protein Salat_0678100 [Sesamum alatum]|uniref:Retrotransposon gag domain-containing protein n=1 Tax=Sesamum alatum TaxID=300844 RepID=A0AAE1YT15_9LAMI|nr:hypothetical protein Salat_0678100 [Sesamum alatum]
MCLEAYLQGQDLRELVVSADTIIPTDTTENVESRRKWKITYAKALFALRTSIDKEYIDHVREVSSSKHVWETLERLFIKQNATRLHLLENELAMLTQGGMSVFEYFLKTKFIYVEISELDPNEKISEAHMRRFLIRGLKEYMPSVISIQGWPNQPSVEVLENLLSNQEALAKQMARKSEPDAILFSKEKFNKKNTSTKNKNHENGSSSKRTTEC